MRNQILGCYWVEKAESLYFKRIGRFSSEPTRRSNPVKNVFVLAVFSLSPTRQRQLAAPALKSAKNKQIALFGDKSIITEPTNKDFALRSKA